MSRGAALLLGQRPVRGVAAPHMPAASVCSVRLLLLQPCTAGGSAAQVAGSPAQCLCRPTSNH